MTDYLAYLRALVNHFDAAMAAEGVTPEVRDRVLTRVMHGTPTPDVEPPARRGPSINIGTTGI